MKKILLILVTLLSGVLNSYAQDFSNKGTDFWVAYGYHQIMQSTFGDFNAQQMVLYFATETTTSVTVSIPRLNYTKVYSNIPANTIFTSDPLPKAGAEDARLLSEGISDKGIHITSDKPIVAYTHIYNASVSGATLLFPTATLGKEYYSVNFTQNSNTSAANCWFYAIAVDPGTTTVEITPSENTLTHAAGVPFTVDLQQGQVINMMGVLNPSDQTKGVDLTGSKIRSISSAAGSCKRIAVFSGSGRINIPCNVSTVASSDNYIVQAFPKNAWGLKYITAPTGGLSNNVFRVCVLDPTTQVKVDGTNITTLTKGFYYEFMSNQPNVIEADKPILVAQYISSESFCGNTGVGDPEVIYLSSIEQNIDKVILNSTQNFAIQNHWINVVIKADAVASFKIDGATITFTPHPKDPLYAYAQIGGLSAGQHTLEASSGFNAIAYGYGNYESYGYNAGTNVKDLYQYVSIKNPEVQTTIPATCKATPFNFSFVFPYQPTEITWKFNGLFPDVSIPAPIFDETWTLNGKQLYRYSLPDNYTIPIVGTYPMKVLAKNPTPDGCNSEQEISFDLKVYEKPAAAFDFTSNGCISSPVSFLDKSNLDGRSNGKWYWDFGDGTTASIKNPDHQFTGNTDFDVKFALSNDIGCVSDEVTKTVTLAALPIAKFNKASLFCEGKEVVFEDASVETGTAITKWIWDFGDGTPIVIATTNVSQKHKYTTTGEFEVKLQVETANGCKSIVYNDKITVNPTPVVDFHLPRVCLPFAATFKQASSIADGSEAEFTYQWNFDDGNTSALKDPNHTFTTLGPFNVKLIVTSNKGCAEEVTKTVTDIYPQPVAAFTMPLESCFGTTISLTDQSTAGRSTVGEWLWTFADGTVLKDQNPSKIFTTPGEQEVQLSVISATGCASAIEKKKIYINELPKSKFTSSTVKCVTRDIQFTDQSTSKDGSIVKWTWDMGDGNVYTSTDALPFMHAFAQAQKYTTKLIIESSKGCISEEEHQEIVVTALPETDFLLPENCLSDPFSHFQNATTIADGTEALITYAWNFGDGNATPANPNTSDLKDPKHKYIEAKKYDVTLTATSNAGCIVSKTSPLFINGSVPVSQFSIKEGLSICSNNAITLINNSFADVGDIVRLEIFWDASDPTSREIDENPLKGKEYIHSYPEFFTPATKSYTIKVIAFSGQTCLKEATLTIEMKATPEIRFDNVSGVCINIPAYTIADAKVINGLTGNYAYTGGSITSNGVFNPSRAGTGTHMLRYTFTADNGCVNFKEKPIEVFELPTIYAGPDVTMLEGTSITLNGIGTGNGISYLWNPFNTLSNSKIASPVATPSENTFYNLTITSADGCIVTDQMFIKVLKHIKIPNVFSPNGDGIHDRWEVAYLATYPGATVEIFNRYGQLVFKSQGYDKPWDGTSNGKPLPVGTYYYLINPKNGRSQVSGFVDIIR